MGGRSQGKSGGGKKKDDRRKLVETQKAKRRKNTSSRKTAQNFRRCANIQTIVSHERVIAIAFTFALYLDTTLLISRRSGCATGGRNQREGESGMANQVKEYRGRQSRIRKETGKKEPRNRITIRGLKEIRNRANPDEKGGGVKKEGRRRQEERGRGKK